MNWTDLLKSRRVWAIVGVSAIILFVSCWACRDRSSFKTIVRNKIDGKPNRLIHEKSPYLLQHAYNPVDWYPWGPEAFEKAKEEHKPLFVSIGYSTCHWCHVMEEESYSDPKTAAIMNKYFVNVKVDREERPDVDQIYMNFVQATTGGGGWPLNVFITPDLKPFFGGTYFPPEPRYGMPSFTQVLTQIAQQWSEKRGELENYGDSIAQQLAAQSQSSGVGVVSKKTLDQAYGGFQGTYDSHYGGFGNNMKFPRPVGFNFLLRYFAQTGNEKAKEMVLKTLREMSKGGIYDQLGGGFHRYSTDEKWRVPHFEKMLYDNALLATSYLEAYQLTNDPFYADMARDILTYISRDMTSPDGGFYSSEDADSAVDSAKPDVKHEGAFYLWRKEELDSLLGADAPLFEYRFGVESNGNTLKDPQGEFGDKNILYQAHSIEETAKKYRLTPGEVKEKLKTIRVKLLQVRSQRPRPFRDEKILVSWNGLMISAYAKAYEVLGDPTYLERAQKCATFIQTKLYDPETKQLYRTYFQGERLVPGILDDYSFLTQGLLDLYEASFEVKWMQWALDLTGTQRKLFYDEKGGGFYTAAQQNDLIMRVKESYDGAEPSGNSIAILNLLRLSQFMESKDLDEEAQKTLQWFSASLNQRPDASPQMLVAYLFASQKPFQIVLSGDWQKPPGSLMRQEVYRRFLPAKIIVGLNKATLPQWREWAPFYQVLLPNQKQTTAYVCRNYACNLPTHDLAVFRNQLSSVGP